MKVLLTGAAGFLGWHTRLRLHAQGQHTVVPVTRDNWEDLPSLLRDVDAVIHLAGVNRAKQSDQVRGGNIALADSLTRALAETSGVRVVYANSAQAGNGTPYGSGKALAGELIDQTTRATSGSVVDVRLPNLFGEHGLPHYNSFVATFIDAAIQGRTPTITDRTVPLLHAQDAAQTLIDALTTLEHTVEPVVEPRGVREVWTLLQEFDRHYSVGEFPDLSTKFRIDLFNAYRAPLFPAHYPIRLTPHTDHRGTFIETVRSRGGAGQSAISTTAPGVTRGEHFHLNKIERFAVVQGHATIALRKMFTGQVTEFRVSGDTPTAIDMPTGWAHNIENTGANTLLTQFWTHEVFRPEAPDTFPEHVRPSPSQESIA